MHTSRYYEFVDMVDELSIGNGYLSATDIESMILCSDLPDYEQDELLDVLHDA